MRAPLLGQIYILLVSKNNEHVALSSDKISFGVKDTSFPNINIILSVDMSQKFCLRDLF